MGRLAIRLAVRRVYSVVSSPCAAAEPRGELGREVGRGEWTVRVAGPFRATPGVALLSFWTILWKRTRLLVNVALY